MKPWTKEIWRTIALLALASAMLLAAACVYAFIAFRSNLDVIINGAPICLAGSRAYDSIAAAQAIGRLDFVSFLFTTAGVILGVFGLLGFWIIRREARDEAREAATEETRKIAQLYFGSQNGKGTNGGDNSHQEGHIGEAPVARSFDPASVSTAGAVEEKGATDGQS